MSKTVTLSRAFDYEVPGKGGRVAVAYPAGFTGSVPEAHADAIVAAGAGSISDAEPAAADSDTSKRRK